PAQPATRWPTLERRRRALPIALRRAASRRLHARIGQSLEPQNERDSTGTCWPDRPRPLAETNIPDRPPLRRPVRTPPGLVRFLPVQPVTQTARRYFAVCRIE